jgi:hypothetical protein
MPTTSSKEWGMLIDQDIIRHLDNPRYLTEIVQCLSGKIEAIMILRHKPEAKAAILNDSRTQQFLSEKEHT